MGDVTASIKFIQVIGGEGNGTGINAGGDHTLDEGGVGIGGIGAGGQQYQAGKYQQDQNAKPFFLFHWPLPPTGAPTVR